MHAGAIKSKRLRTKFAFYHKPINHACPPTSPKEDNANQKKRIRVKAEVAKMMVRFKKDGCYKCGEKEPICLDAHHVDPSQKRFSISQIFHSSDVKKFKDELDKCVPICANCHRKLHAGLFVEDMLLMEGR